MKRNHYQIITKLIIFSIILISSNSCSWQRCQVKGMLLVKATQRSHITDLNATRTFADPGLFIKERIINSNSIINVIQELKLTNKRKQPLSQKEFIDNLIVENLGHSDVVIISYENTDKVLAVKIINLLMDFHIRYEMNEQYQEELNKKSPEERKKIEEEQKIVKTYLKNLKTFQETCKKLSCKEISKENLSDRDRLYLIELELKLDESYDKYQKISPDFDILRPYSSNIEIIEAAKYPCSESIKLKFYL